MDEIINDVRTQRESYAAEFGYSIQRLYHDAKNRETERGCNLVILKPKELSKQGGVATSNNPLQ